MVIKGGIESPNREKVFLKSALPIVLAVCFERLSYYSSVGSLTLFFTQKLGYSNVRATQMQSIQQAIVFTLPIVGGVIADVYLGRYKMALLAAIISTIGIAIMAIGSFPSILEKASWIFIVGLLGVFSIGCATFKPVLIVFGGDQFAPSVPELIPQRKLYFDSIYFFTNVGSFIAYGVMSSLAVNGMGAISQKYSFWFTFLLGCILYAMSGVILFAFNKFYWVKPQEESALGLFGRITSDALKNRTSSKGVIVITSATGLVISVLGSIVGFFWDNKAFQIVLAVLIVISCIGLVAFGSKQKWVHDAASSSRVGAAYQAENIQEVADTYRILPFVALAIPFWAVYNQINTNFVLQGCQMYSPTSFFVSSTMSLFNALGCMVFAVLLNTAFIPLFKKLNYPLTNMRRIVIGLLVTAAAVGIAAGVEVYRRSTPIAMTECTVDMAQQDKPLCSENEVGQKVKILSNCISYDGAKGRWPEVYVNEASLFWMVFPYFVVGCAEILVAATYYDVFYAEVPPILRTLCQTMSNFATSLGTLIGAVVNTLMDSLITNDLNGGHLEYVYLVYVVLTLASMVFQWWFSKRFVCRADLEYLEQIRLQKEGVKPGTLMAEAEKQSSTHHTSSSSEEEGIKSAEKIPQTAG